MTSSSTNNIFANALPSGPTVAFRESSFFSQNNPDVVLPSPREVLAKSESQEPNFHHRSYHRPVIFESLGLVVKFGKEPSVSIAEGQCLWALRRCLPSVPVPEIYGWTEEDDQIFLYIQLLQGATLEKRWETLCDDERVSVCGQLRDMISDLRQLKQEPEDQFLGHIDRGPYTDIVFTNGTLPRAGPFASVREFHNWLSTMTKLHVWNAHWKGYELEDVPDPFRQMLPDDASVVFTHSDLHPSNIMVSEDNPCRVVALIDWHQSGWYPDYWEFSKAEFTAEPRSEWVTKYLPMFLQEPSETCFEGFESYAATFGY
ncbi:hypothetical protein FGRMN_6499 [Fusarium graminum]|nr:hypothetical protein FGRMN_6499 [Fusarium graminum]